MCCQSICLPPSLPPSPSLLFASALYLFFFFSKHTLTFSSPNSLDASGSVSPGEMCHLLSDIPAVPSRTNLCSIKMDQDQGFFFPPRIVHLYYYIWHSRSWWVHGKSESWLLTLSTVFCSTLGLFGSILLPVSHFISNIDNPSEHSPHKDAIIKSNLIFFFFYPKYFHSVQRRVWSQGEELSVRFCWVLIPVGIPSAARKPGWIYKKWSRTCCWNQSALR